MKHEYDQTKLDLFLKQIVTNLDAVSDEIAKNIPYTFRRKHGAVPPNMHEAMIPMHREYQSVMSDWYDFQIAARLRKTNLGWEWLQYKKNKLLKEWETFINAVRSKRDNLQQIRASLLMLAAASLKIAMDLERITNEDRSRGHKNRVGEAKKVDPYDIDLSAIDADDMD